MGVLQPDQYSPRPSQETASEFILFFCSVLLGSRAERPSVSGVNLQLHVQVGTKQAFFFAA